MENSRSQQWSRHIGIDLSDDPDRFDTELTPWLIVLRGLVNQSPEINNRPQLQGLEGDEYYFALIGLLPSINFATYHQLAQELSTEDEGTLLIAKLLILAGKWTINSVIPDDVAMLLAETLAAFSYEQILRALNLMENELNITDFLTDYEQVLAGFLQ